MTDHGATARATGEGYPSLWQNQDFLRFFFGQFISNAGDSLYTVAIMWLVFDLSGSTFLTGIASSLLLLPWLLQIIAGPIVDRFPIKPVLVGSQVVQGIVVLTLPIAAYTGNLTVELILVMIPALSLVNLVVSPAQATLVPRIVSDEQLPRSNSALATVTLGLDMIFDALGGIFIAVFGATILFVLDSVTFAVAGLLFFGIAIPAVDGGNDGSGPSAESAIATYVADMRAGIETLRGTVFIDMILTTAVANFAVGVTLAILPAFSESLGGAAIYGSLLGALGIGRLIGSVSASYLDDVPYGRWTAVSYLFATLCWLGSVYSPSVILTIGLFGLAWIPPGINGVMISTLNQKVFPDRLLGRVSSIKGTASGATLPLGSVVGGLIAEHLGTTSTMGLAAFGFGFVCLYFVLRPSLRHLPAMNDVDPAAFHVRVDTPSASGNADEGIESR